MKTLLILVGLSLVLAVCWPLVVLTVVLMVVFWPLACILIIPLAVIGIHMSAPVALLALVAALFYLPMKILGRREQPHGPSSSGPTSGQPCTG